MPHDLGDQKNWKTIRLALFPGIYWSSWSRRMGIVKLSNCMARNFIGKDRRPILRMEVVCDDNLHIWYVMFGTLWTTVRCLMKFEMESGYLFEQKYRLQVMFCQTRSTIWRMGYITSMHFLPYLIPTLLQWKGRRVGLILAWLGKR